MLIAWLGRLAPATPEVTLDLPPPPDPLGPVASIIGALGLLLIVTVVLRRVLRGRKGAATMFAFSVGVGNALMELGALLQPDRPKVMVVAKKDDGASPAVPGEPPSEQVQPRAASHASTSDVSPS